MRRLLGVPLCLVLALLCACSGAGRGSGGSIAIGNSQTADPGSVDYPIFYVKRTIPTTPDDLRLLRPYSPGADLYMRASASPDARETNITARVTAASQGGMAGGWDVKDVDASPDGKKVAFAMRGPLKANQDPKDPPSWRIWEYTIATDTLAPMIDPSLDIDPAEVNDVSPHYLPDGSLLFSSTRQHQSKAVLLDEGKPQFEAQDEARQESAFNLHVINPQRTELTQITFNQSHDRDATVLQDGRILFTRWDNTPGHDAMSLYTANPDGSNLQLYYGVNSHATGTGHATIEFVQPRETQDGHIVTLIRPYTEGMDGATGKLDFGGDLVLIDGTHFVENTQSAVAGATVTGSAQSEATALSVRSVPGPSPGGRFGSVYPLWDGTGRLLVTWTPCRLVDPDTGLFAFCEEPLLSNPQVQTAPPLYSAWIYDPASGTLLPLMQTPEGVMVTDVVAAQPRARLPNIILPTAGQDARSAQLKNTGQGVLDIRSVYDMDGVDTAPGGIAALADGQMPAAQRPIRFLRVVKAVSIPDQDVVKLSDAAFGASNFMREIVGYIPVEPDGSVRVQVPANVALQIQMLDANARLVGPQHGVWLQVVPGETLSCNGCHTPAAAQNVAACPANALVCPTARSHGRAGAFASAYAGAVGGSPYPGSLAQQTLADGTVVSLVPLAGETMAQTRARVSCDKQALCSQVPSLDVVFNEVWTMGRNPVISYPYAGTDGLKDPEVPPVSSAACGTTWAPVCRTRINYPQHIQPIWDSPRMDATGKDITCSTTCHSTANAATAAHLDLSSTASNAVPEEFVSYIDLVREQTTTDDQGNVSHLAGPFLDPGNANGVHSRAALAMFAPGSGDTIHAGSLTPAELRLISEWLDIGAQYFNNPFDPAVPTN